MIPPFSATRAILRKRQGGSHPPGEIGEFIRGFVEGRIADYQMTAWMMAVYFSGLDRRETAELTRAMLESGRRLERWDEGPPVIDKHSTGGVGDKVSIALAPLAAACGLRVPMISGRALGHTGGTLDKLESIPGYRTKLDGGEFRRIVNEIGCSIAGATEDLVPADRRMYALRDVSGTIESHPLIVSSIVSKKAAARLDGLVLDVKVGHGGFAPDHASAHRLARRLVEVSTDMGIATVATLTAMADPLGRCVGNALEIREAVELLRGESRSAALLQVCLDLTARMLSVAGLADDTAARGLVERALSDGTGLDRLGRMIAAHGGDADVVEAPARVLPRAARIEGLEAAEEGWIQSIDARELGEIVIDMGGGRRRAVDVVDPSVGIELLVDRGDRVAPGAPIAVLHLPSGFDEAAVAARLRAAIHIGPDRPPPDPAVLETISIEP